MRMPSSYETGHSMLLNLLSSVLDVMRIDPHEGNSVLGVLQGKDVQTTQYQADMGRAHDCS